MHVCWPWKKINILNKYFEVMKYRYKCIVFTFERLTENIILNCKILYNLFI